MNLGTQEALKQYSLALEDLGGQTEKGRMSAIIANLALATYQRGNYPKSVQLFEQAIKTDPRLSYSYQMYATVERQQGNYGKANELFKTASQLNPQNPIIWSSWAMLKKDEADLVTSEEMLNQGLKLRPNDLLLLQQLAVVKSMRGRFSEAIEICKGKINTSPSNERDRRMNTYFLGSLGETYWKWGLYCQQQGGNVTEGLSKFQEALKIIRDSEPISFPDWRITKETKKLERASGIAFRRLRRYDEAIASLKRALFSSPKFAAQHEHNRKVNIDLVLTIKYAGKREEMVKLATECGRIYQDDRFVEWTKE